MTHALQKRPFPKQLFEQLSKTECQHFIEALHYTTEANSPEDVKGALSRFQNLFSFTRVIGGLARLSPKGVIGGDPGKLGRAYAHE